MGILVLLDHPHRSLILKSLLTPVNFFGWMKQKKEKEKKNAKRLKNNKFISDFIHLILTYLQIIYLVLSDLI